MTAYKNFISDFPRRCIDILDLAKAGSRASGRDVTLVIMVASASLVIPLERLRIKASGDAHPIGDLERFPDSAQQLQGLLKSPFVGSKIGPPADQKSWKLAQRLTNIEGDAEQWMARAQLKPVSGEKTVKAILELMRNALAHGNLFTIGDPIASLVFVNFHWKNLPKGAPAEWVNFDALQVPPADLDELLCKWVEFLHQSNFLRLKLAA